ncbi:DUF5953 family protein [Corallococcus exiguus]|uniref:Immunity protein 52 domain-containing protein n=1 Tax=Corallococcus exiguus TaxID=83462 RepID=A0A7X5BSM3_9BACT|nr:DUF5953 family protein [Corallococcus exiguus]NBC44446.1 hypothetical protein [Corallococcus exiguus]TNV62250.1 hypothetical protein FH620_18705 [Corallococcus exiguus]
MTTQSTLGIIVYAPPLLARDERTLAVVHGMERAFPGLRLAWKISEEGRLIALPQRDTWLSEGTRDGGFPLVCNGDESFPVMIYGLQIPARQAPGGQPLFDAHAELPLDEAVIAAAADVLVGVAEGARAFWGHATPSSAGVEIARQTRDPVHKPGIPPRGLPALKLPEKSRAPEIPHRLGWLNYWSAAAAKVIGFPDPTRDAELLSRARRTESGGWVVQLTDAPLDLDNPAHLDALQRAYERFPEIGGRAPP